MASWFRTLVFAFLLIGGGIGCTACKATEPLVVGVNVENPDRLSSAQREQLLQQLANFRVKVIRFPVNNSASLEFAIRAFQMGIKSILVFYLDADPSAVRLPVPLGNSQVWPGVGLSGSSPDLTEQRMKKQIAVLERSRVRLEAIEVGNEINWAPFNRDLPTSGTGKVFSLTDLFIPGEGQKIASGLDKYVSAVKAARVVRDASLVNRGVPLLIAGLADVGEDGSDLHSSLSAISVRATVSYLFAHGLDQAVDGIGLHVYLKSSGANLASTFDGLRRGPLSSCGLSGKPCWITEWNMSFDEHRTGEDAAAVAGTSIMDQFDKLAAENVIRASILYCWSSTNPSEASLQIYRNGKLTEFGDAVIEQSLPRLH